MRFFPKDFCWGFFIFVVAFIGIIAPCVIGDKLPGDIVDARFNAYVLEHFFQALTHQANSFINADFFYPLPETIMLSDTHWGSGFIYAFFRSSGASLEDAYAAWIMAAFVFTYIAAFYVYLKLDLSRFAAAIAAFLFAFGLPVLAQDMHSQPLFRAFVPLAFLTFYRYLQSRNLCYIALTIFFIAAQLLISAYSGLFLILLLACFGASWLWIAPRHKIAEILPQKFSLKFTLPLLALSVALLLIFALPYLQVKHDYNFDRKYIEAVAMLPRLQSYFMADHSHLWFSAFNKSDTILMRHEHQLFVGIGAFICLLLVFLRRDFRQNLLAKKMVGASILMVLASFYVAGISFYPLVMQLPGFSSLRAISREILVLLLPLGYLTGLALDKIREFESEKFSARTAIFVLSVLIISDSLLADRYLTSKKEWQKRIEILQEKMPAKLDESSVLVIRSTCVADEIDAMLLAQKLGIKTIHGYSGHFPISLPTTESCDLINQRIDRYEELMRSNFDANFVFDRSKLIYAGIAKCVN